MYKAEIMPGQFTEALATGQRAACPSCKGEVLSRCGVIVANHWAHVSGTECDAWAQPMTDWHYNWQACVPIERREVVMGPHRADAVAHDGSVIEFQHSSITGEEINEREAFYGNMSWVFDARKATEAHRLMIRDRGSHRTFQWRQARKSITSCAERVFLDVGHDCLFMLIGIYPDAPIEGYGHLISHQTFRAWADQGPPIPNSNAPIALPHDSEASYILRPCRCPSCEPLITPVRMEPKSVAGALLKNLSSDSIAEVIRLLTDSK